ncbi:MAG: D-erythro-7,8-dihydroneopterin triphosphate epimerase [Planctomycetota bacterium]|jgi:D-erythro-7,8-dihydroneopterin triphosphate epimerase
MDKIRIEDLRLRCIIGLNPEEREKQQDVVIQATMHADLRKAGQSDEVEHTVNYKTIKNSIVKHVEASSYQLIERLAETVAELCLTNERVHHVDLRVDKPGALRFARTVSVEITRGRE